MSPLLLQMPDTLIFHGDNGYDSDAIRHRVEERGALPNIPPKANRRWKTDSRRCSPAIERMFARLRDFRRMAKNFAAAICFAAASATGYEFGA